MIENTKSNAASFLGNGNLSNFKEANDSLLIDLLDDKNNIDNEEKNITHTFITNSTQSLSSITGDYSHLPGYLKLNSLESDSLNNDSDEVKETDKADTVENTDTVDEADDKENKDEISDEDYELVRSNPDHAKAYDLVSKKDYKVNFIDKIIAQNYPDSLLARALSEREDLEFDKFDRETLAMKHESAYSRKLLERLKNGEFELTEEDFNFAAEHYDTKFAKAVSGRKDFPITDSVREVLRAHVESEFAKNIIQREDFSLNENDIKYINENPNSDFAGYIASLEGEKSLINIDDYRSFTRKEPRFKLSQAILNRSDYTLNEEDLDFIAKNPDSDFTRIIAEREGDKSLLNIDDYRSYIRDNPYSQLANTFMKRSDYSLSEDDYSFVRSNPQAIFGSLVVNKKDKEGNYLYKYSKEDKEIGFSSKNISFGLSLIKRSDYIVEDVDKEYARSNPFSFISQELAKKADYVIDDKDKEAIRKNSLSTYARTLMNKDSFYVDDEDRQNIRENQYQQYTYDLLGLVDAGGNYKYTLESEDIEIARNDLNGVFAEKIILRGDYLLEDKDYELAGKNPLSRFAMYIRGNPNFDVDKLKPYQTAETS